MAGQEVFVPSSTVRCIEVRPSKTTGKWYAILEQDFDVCLPGGRDLLGEQPDYEAELRSTGRSETLSCTYSLKATTAKKPSAKAIQQLLDARPELRIVRLVSSHARPGFRAKLLGKSHKSKAGLLVLDRHNRPIYQLAYLSDGSDNLPAGEVDQRSAQADDCSPVPAELLGMYPASLAYASEQPIGRGEIRSERVPAHIAAQLARA